ncbi:MAG TPA: zf-TFIIB domain-containing protein [Solirubrobacterales bacterium]|nr:zf-TFIIB domain-containing protein [Solirubrobacterales bacterium]
MSNVTPEEASAQTTMTCPKCGGQMHANKRNGVTIEQCRKCHGIFLDRGEFEQLMSRETSFLGNGESLSGQSAGGGGRASRWKKPWRR